MTDSSKPYEQLPTLSALRRALLISCKLLIYIYVLHEVSQQPVTWHDCYGQTLGRALHDLLAEIKAKPLQHIAFTGARNSPYISECMAPVLQARSHAPYRAVVVATIRTAPQRVSAPGSELLVPIARSSDSSESADVADVVHAEILRWTCLGAARNTQGLLAVRFSNKTLMHVVLLNAVTNDRSLVTINSLTNSLATGGDMLQKDRSADLVTALIDTVFERYGDALADRDGRCIDAGRI